MGCIVEIIHRVAGLTGTLKLYPLGSDTIANGAGDALLAQTNRTWVYRATVAEALSGTYQAYWIDGSGNVLYTGVVDLESDDAVHVVGELADLPIRTRASQSDLTAVKNKTDNLPASPAAVGSAMTLADGAITAAKIATGAIDADAIAADGAAEIAAALAGTGARTVVIAVDDGTDALQGAQVRVTFGSESYLRSTDANGQVTFNLDDHTWTVAITMSGYTFAGDTLTVDGDETATYSMSATGGAVASWPVGHGPT